MIRWGVRHRGSDERGATLIEMLVVVAILSIAIVTFAVGLQTSQTATSDAHVRQKMHLALGSFRSAISTAVANEYWRPPPAGADCPDTSLSEDVLDALDADPVTVSWDLPYQGSGMTFEVVSVRYWQGGPAFPVNGVISPGAFSGGCGSQDLSAQELTLRVSQSTMSRPVEGAVVVRKPV